MALFFFVGALSPPILAPATTHDEVLESDGQLAAEAEAVEVSAPSVGENPFGYAKTFEDNRSVTPDHGKLELSCAIPNQNLSSTCITRLKSERVAFVNPIFTTTAYKKNGFYDFYSRHTVKGNAIFTRSDLALLNVSVLNGWGASLGLLSFIQMYEAKGYLRTATPILTDIDINNGSLFSKNGSRLYDSVVVGFSEYVTVGEYQSYMHFVETGGTLIFLNACNFIAQVQYYPSTGKLALVSGHSWNFNGTAAWPGPFSRWSSYNSNWIGSDYKLFYEQGYTIGGGTVSNSSNPIALAFRVAFGNNVFQSGYYGHEENVITNASDSIIVNWDVDNWSNSTQVVATYSHLYGHGLVIHSGIFGTDIIEKNYQMQFFLLVSMLSASS